MHKCLINKCLDMSNTVSESEVNWHCCSPWNREIFNILGRHYPIVSRGGFSPVLSDAANKMASECPRVLPLSNSRETNTGADVNVAKTAEWKQKKGPEEWISNTILTASSVRKRSRKNQLEYFVFNWNVLIGISSAVWSDVAQPFGRTLEDFLSIVLHC